MALVFDGYGRFLQGTAEIPCNGGMVVFGAVEVMNQFSQIWFEQLRMMIGAKTNCPGSPHGWNRIGYKEQIHQLPETSWIRSNIIADQFSLFSGTFLQQLFINIHVQVSGNYFRNRARIRSNPFL